MLKPEYVNDTLKGTEDVFLLLNLRDFSDFSNSIIKDNLLLHFDGEERKKIEFLLDWTREEQSNNAPARNLIMYSSLSMILSLVLKCRTASLSAVTTPHFIRLRVTRFISSVYSTADGTLCRYFSESHTMNNTESLSFGVAICFVFIRYVLKNS
jgi:hypothetical protein